MRLSAKRTTPLRSRGQSRHPELVEVTDGESAVDAQLTEAFLDVGWAEVLQPSEQVPAQIFGHWFNAAHPWTTVSDVSRIAALTCARQVAAAPW